MPAAPVERWTRRRNDLRRVFVTFLAAVRSRWTKAKDAGFESGLGRISPASFPDDGITEKKLLHSVTSPGELTLDGALL
jgi:hypothetical protein